MGLDRVQRIAAGVGLGFVAALLVRAVASDSISPFEFTIVWVAVAVGVWRLTKPRVAQADTDPNR